MFEENRIVSADRVVACLYGLCETCPASSDKDLLVEEKDIIYAPIKSCLNVDKQRNIMLSQCYHKQEILRRYPLEIILMCSICPTAPLTIPMTDMFINKARKNNVKLTRAVNVKVFTSMGIYFTL